jgi:hypothetical protein
MNETDKLKIEVFDLEKDQQKYAEVARELGRKIAEKREQITKLEGSGPDALKTS